MSCCDSVWCRAYACSIVTCELNQLCLTLINIWSACCSVSTSSSFTFSYIFVLFHVHFHPLDALSLSRPLFTWWIKQIFSQQILKASCERKGREIACHHSSNTNFYSCFISEIFLVVYFVVYFLWLKSFLAVCECEALFFFVERNNST